MNNSWSTPIDKLMLWRADSWARCEPKATKLTLRIHYDLLLITTDTKVLESFNINGKMKGFYKEDILILIISNMTEIRKLKFQIKSNLTQCLQNLSQHFPVINYNMTESKNIIQSRYRNIDDVLKSAIDEKDTLGIINLPTSYKNFVKLCLLDPTFPDMIAATQKILDDLK